MRRIARCAWMAMVLLGSSGCAYTSFVGNDGNRSGQFFGEVGITGQNNDLTVESGSRLRKLSIIGDDNRVMVQSGVTLGKIEFYGKGNRVSIVEGLTVRITQVGRENVIERRPLEPKVDPLLNEGGISVYRRWPAEMGANRASPQPAAPSESSSGSGTQAPPGEE